MTEKNYVHTLVTVPSGDSNFIYALQKYASKDDLNEALKQVMKLLEKGEMVKTKITAITREIRRREKEAAHD